MKLPNFLYISLTAFLSLVACNSNTNEKNNKSSFSDPLAKGPSINKDATLSFNNVTDTCIVTPKVKTYVDAMKGQEKTLEYPYRLSSLYGPDDYHANALKEETEDGFIYNKEDKGGVDVCDYLNNLDYAKTCENVPIKISWSKGNLDYKKALVKYWPKANKEETKYIDANDDLISADLPNLYRNTEYCYQVIADSKTTRYTSQEVKFKVEDYPRTITMGDVKNVRDLGGYMTSYGLRTNQGIIYRGSDIKVFDEECQHIQDDIMHIGVDIDLGDKNKCFQVEHLEAKISSYEDFINDEKSMKSLVKIFNALANADKKHVYLHCPNGADLTGLVSFMINAVLGVSYTDLIIDYELSSEVTNKRCHMHNSKNGYFPKFIDSLLNYAGYDDTQTLNQNVEGFLIDKGVSYKTIDKVRQVMLPDYKEGMKEVEPVYTPTGEWIQDELAHYKKAKENPLVKCLYHRHTFINNDKKESGHGVTYLICSECGYENEVLEYAK